MSEPSNSSWITYLGVPSIAALLVAGVYWLLNLIGIDVYTWIKQRITGKGKYVVGFEDYYDLEMPRHAHPYAVREEVGRESGSTQSDPVRQISEWVDGPGRFLVLYGAGSSGKSRTCIETAKRTSLRWIKSKGYASTPDTLANGLEPLVSKNRIYVFEDYDEFSAFFDKVCDIVFRRKARLIVISKDDLGPMHTIWKAQLATSAEIQRIHLSTVTADTIQRVVRNRARPGNPDSSTLQNIASISDGLPGIAVLAYDLSTQDNKILQSQSKEQLLDRIFDRCREDLGNSRWEELKGPLGKLALLRGDQIEAVTYEKLEVAMGGDGLLVRDETGLVQIQPSALNDHLAKRCFFSNGSIGELEAVLKPEVVAAKSVAILTTLANCGQRKAVALLLAKAKGLDARTVLDLGIRTYDYSKDIAFVQECLGDFWRLADQVNDFELNHRTALFLCQLAKWKDADSCWHNALKLAEEQGDPWRVGVVYNNLGRMQWLRSDLPKAADFQRKALESFKTMDGKKWERAFGLAQTYLELATISRDLSDKNQAVANVHLAIEEFSRVEGSYGELCRANGMAVLGWVCHAFNEFDAAVAPYEQALALYLKLNNLSGQAASNAALSAIFAEKNDWDRASRYYQDALAALQGVGDLHEVAKIYLRFGYLYLRKSDWKQSETFFVHSEELSEQLGNACGRAAALNGLGEVFTLQGKWSAARDTYGAAFTISKDLEDTADKARAQIGLARIATNTGNWDEAAQISQAALEVFSKLGPKQPIAALHGDLAFICARKGDFDQASSHCKTAASLYAEMDSPSGIASVNVTQGYIQEEQGRYADALAYYYRALEYYVQNNVSHGIAAVYNNLGLVFVIQGESRKAIDLLQQGIRFAEGIGDRQLKSYSLTIVGMAHSELREWADAERCFAEGLAIKRELRDPYGIAWTEGEVGKMYMRQGKLDEARESLLSSLGTFSALGAKADASRVRRHIDELAALHRGKGGAARADEVLREGRKLDEAG